jgi:hypothetical protein
MTVRELIVALTRVDPDSRPAIYNPASPGDVLEVVGVDPYREHTVLVLAEAEG